MEKIFTLYLIGCIVSFIITFVNSYVYVKNDGSRGNSTEDCCIISFLLGFGSWLTILLWLLGVFDDFSPYVMCRSIQIKCGIPLSADDAYQLAVKRQKELHKKEVKQELQKVLGDIRDALDDGQCYVTITYPLLSETISKLESMGYKIEGKGRFQTINFDKKKQ